MIFTNGEEIIRVMRKGRNRISFESEELAWCRLRLRVATDYWLKKNGYIYIGHFW